MALTGLVKLFLLLLSLNLTIHRPVNGGRSISEEEDVEFERQLKSLNKPPIKTIQTEVGDIIDCIEVNKQPALDHPLLKNHKIQMRPISLPKELIDETSSADERSESMLRSIGCPQGTVPIRRTSKEDLIRAKSFTNSYAASTFHPHSTDSPGHHFAVLQSKREYNLTFNGIQTIFNAYNISVAADQTSGAQMWIENGPPQELNSLQVGWMVAPELYGDSQTRTFIYWTADGGQGTGCFNLFCSGFVLVNKDYDVSGIVSPVSTYKGTQHELKMSIIKDPPTGNWWLTVSRESIQVGYFPKAIVPHLEGGALDVAWGGHTKSSLNGVSPPMGSGHLPNHSFDEACWFRGLKFVNISNLLETPHEGQLLQYEDSHICYRLDNYGVIINWGHSFLFGGPGGDNCGV